PAEERERLQVPRPPRRRRPQPIGLADPHPGTPGTPPRPPRRPTRPHVGPPPPTPADCVFPRPAGEPFQAAGLDLVVTVGGDGTLLSASHYVDDVPILAINSAPSHSVGFFCGARSGEAKSAITAAMRGTLRRTVLTRMKVTLNGEVVAGRVLNDTLFCHASPAATSRYILELGETFEQQKSSGMWIGPAAGSTAAQRSAGG